MTLKGYVSEEQQNQIIEFLNESSWGMSYKEIRKRFGIGYYRVQSLMKELIEKGLVEKSELGRQIFFKKVFKV